MTEEDPPGVREVREWRRKVAQDWEGKSWEEISRLLEDRTARFERQRLAYWQSQESSGEPVG
ncbi:MAG: hypothetical protein AB1758_04070 [Candidatus Eremiobacterota bacterium]